MTQTGPGHHLAKALEVHAVPQGRQPQGEGFSVRIEGRQDNGRVGEAPVAFGVGHDRDVEERSRTDAGPTITKVK